MKNYGSKVTIVFKNNSPFYSLIPTVLRNVTEIHYNYNNQFQDKGLTNFNDVMIAYESDIHNTGITYPFIYIKEFYTSLESEISENF